MKKFKFILLVSLFVVVLSSCDLVGPFDDVMIDDVNLQVSLAEAQKISNAESQSNNASEADKDGMDQSESEQEYSESIEQGELFELTVIGEELLYEPMQSAYPAGTVVVGKLKLATSTMTMFVSINGKLVHHYVSDEPEDERTHSCFKFTMPEEPLTVYIIPHENYRPTFPVEIPFLRTYWSAHPEYSHVEFRKYYGGYGKIQMYQVAMMKTYPAEQTEIEPWIETVAGVGFEYRDHHRIWVYKSFEIYTLTDAYEKGIINEDEVRNIADKHIESLSELYPQT